MLLTSVLNILLAGSLFVLVLGEISYEDEKPQGIVDALLGKHCKNDTDCQKTECCTPTYGTGLRCRGHLSEGTICATFTEIVISRQHRRCQCEAGTSCKNAGSILGIYKLFKCQKPTA